MGTKNFAILRIQKVKSLVGLAGRAKHNLREAPTPNADPTKKNEVFGPSTAAEITLEWRAQVKKQKVRSNAVYAVEYLLTASPDFFKGKTEKQLKEWARRSLQYLIKKHGKENIISAVLHLDETTPHWQVLVVPIDPKGNLNASYFFDGKAMMSKMQDDYHASVEKLGLERGIKGSRAEHGSMKEFYKVLDEVSKPIPALSKADHAAAAVGIETSAYREQKKAVAASQLRAKAPNRENMRQAETIEAQKAKAEAEKELVRANARAEGLKRNNIETESKLALTQEYLMEQTKALELQAADTEFWKQKYKKEFPDDKKNVLRFVKPN